MSVQLLHEIKALIERLPVGVNSDFDRSEVNRLMNEAGVIRTVEHGSLWYELIWCQKEIVESHRQRVLEEIRKMLEHPEWTLTPKPPVSAPETWSDARMLALKKGCWDCQWWTDKTCAASRLPQHTKEKGPVPDDIAVGMRDCKRDAEDRRGDPVGLDPRLD